MTAVAGENEKLDLQPLLGHLCSAVGHQVINALSAIVSQGEILRSIAAMPESGNEVQDRLASIVRTAMNASTLTRRLIELSHDLTAVDIERPGDPVEEIALNPLIETILEEEKGRYGNRVAWTTRYASVPPLRGKSEALRTMFRLLFQNAVESFKNGAGAIEVSTHTGARNWIIVEIRDNGRGMEPAILDRTIEPFFTTKLNRLGAGLTIARGIWRRHHGSLTVESNPGEGTTIRLSAPSANGP